MNWCLLTLYCICNNTPNMSIHTITTYLVHRPFRYTLCVRMGLVYVLAAVLAGHYLHERTLTQCDAVLVQQRVGNYTGDWVFFNTPKYALGNVTFNVTGALSFSRPDPKGCTMDSSVRNKIVIVQPVFCSVSKSWMSWRDCTRWWGNEGTRIGNVEHSGLRLRTIATSCAVCVHHFKEWRCCWTTHGHIERCCNSNTFVRGP